MQDILLSLVAPHLCCGCGKMGSLLCVDCKYNITNDQIDTCLACGKPCSERGVCRECRLPYSRAWVVGERTGALQRLIGTFKFERARAGYKDIAELLLTILPYLPADTVIVPMPTVASHIRERGYDHTLLIARYIAKRRAMRVEQVLTRISTTTQRHATASERRRQAKQAFGARRPLDPQTPYLLIDDIVTTGASVYWAARSLKEAGAKTVWVAVAARQTLD